MSQHSVNFENLRTPCTEKSRSSVAERAYYYYSTTTLRTNYETEWRDGPSIDEL